MYRFIYIFVSSKDMYHIKDSEFIRGKVPMTKEEVRAVTLAKLDIRENDVCIDIGAGTGSVTCEMARFSKTGKVYAIEVNSEGIDLIKQNAEKFNLSNIETIEGKAPELLPKVKMNRVFVGGSKGELEEIVKYAKENLIQDGKIVFNFIVLENMMKSIELLKKYEFKNIDISQIIVSKNRALGELNMLMAENPIFIISGEM